MRRGPLVEGRSSLLRSEITLVLVLIALLLPGALLLPASSLAAISAALLLALGIIRLVLRPILEHRADARRLQQMRDEVSGFSRLLPDLFAMADAEGRFLFANEAWETELGHSPGALLAMQFTDLAHPDEVEEVRRGVRSLSAEVSSRERRVRAADGSYRWVSFKAVTSPDGQRIYLLGRDVTEYRRLDDEQRRLLADETRRREREEFLARVSEMLSRTLNSRELLDLVARLPLPFFADWCVVEIGANGQRRSACAHLSPEREAVLRALQERCPPILDGCYAQVVQEGQTYLTPEVDPAALGQLVHTPEQLEVLLSLAPRSTLAAPLKAPGRTLGMIAFVRSDPLRAYSEADRSLAEDLAYRISLALDNALLYEQEQAAVRRLEETVAQLDTVLVDATVGFALLDRELRYLKVNQALAAMNGVPVEAHLGRTIRQVVPDVAPVLEPLFRRVIETGTSLVNLELSGETPAKPGETRYWLENIYPVHRADGETIGIGVIVFEVTDLKITQVALRESEAILAGQRAILELIATGTPLDGVLEEIARLVERHVPKSHCGILLLEGSGEYLRYHAAPTLPLDPKQRQTRVAVRLSADPCALAIRTQEPVLATDIQQDERWSEEHREMARSHGLQSVLAVPITTFSQEPLGVVRVYYTRSAEPTEEELRLVEAATRVAAIAIQRHEAEEGREQNLGSLIRHMAEGVVAVDNHQRILFANPSGSRLLQLKQEVAGLRLDEAGLPDPLAEALRQVCRPGQESPEAITFRLGPTVVEAHLSPVYSDLHFHGAVAIFRDATAQAQLRRLQEQFVANVSHELRGPLASLSATLEAFADGVIPEAARPRYLQAMLTEMDRLRRLSYEVVDLTRLEAGVTNLQREVVDLRLVARQASLQFARRCEQARISLLVDDPDLRVVGDTQRVMQVVANLIENAVRYTPAGGSIRIFARRDGAFARLLVADTGDGIPEEHLPYIWERFYKVDPARTISSESGTGLGLAIVKQLVETMGGEVEVVSTVGVGTTFSLSLPLAQEEA